jgi:hypothetical protein
MEPLKASCAGIVMTGDLNAPPDEALHATMAEAGFLSAHKVRIGVTLWLCYIIMFLCKI